MRRSLASQHRIKTAHHLLNIVALKREMDTYNVEGLLKAASTGHSKEACLKYAALHTALLFEKRSIEELGNVARSAPTAASRRGFGGISDSLGLTGLGNSISNAAGSAGNYLSGLLPTPKPMDPAQKKSIYGIPGLRTEAAAPKFPRDGFTAGGSLKQQPAPQVPSGSLRYNPNAADPVRDAQIAASNASNALESGVPSFADNERVPSNFGGAPAVTAAKAVAKTPAKPTPASVIPKPAATGSADPFAANSAAYAKAQGATGAQGASGVQGAAKRPAKPVNPDTFNDITGKSTPAAKPSRDPFAANSAAYAKAQGAAQPSYTEDPVEAAYSKKLNQGAAQSAGRQQATNIASGIGNFMSNFGKTTANAVNSASNAMGGAKAPSTGYAASQSAYGASPAAASAPAQNDYDSQIAESQRYSDASKQQGDEDAYMKSIEPTAPTYSVSGAAGSTGSTGQEEVARQSQPQQPQGRQTVIGSGAPLQAMQNNRQMRIQRRRGL
jgi:hypothetical protein